MKDAILKIISNLDVTSLSQEERSEIASAMRHKMQAPGIIWAPEDYAEFTDNSEVVSMAYEAHSRHNDLTDFDWDVIQAIVASVE